MEDLELEIDDELLNCIHQPASLSEGITYQDSLLSMKQKMIVNYDLLDLDGEYGFLQDFTQDEIHGYFRQMKRFASISMNDIIEKLDYTNHFNESKIRGNILRLLKGKTQKRIDDSVMIYHFALEPGSRVTANRESGARNARVYFLIGKFGIVHILFFDPYHEINP